MATSSRVGVTVLMLTTAVLGLAAVDAAPAGGRGIGIWPVGAAIAALLLSPRRRARQLAVLTALVALATIWVGGRPPTVAAGLAVGIGLETWVVWWILTDRRPGRPRLMTNADLARFLGGSALGACVVWVATFATAALTGFGTPWLTALTVGTAQLCSLLTVLPFFLQLRGHEPTAAIVERVVQWVLIVTVSLLVFLPHDFPGLVFMVLPVLAWGALRAGPYEALAQTVAVFGVAIQLTTFGFGPFADVPATYGLPVDTRPILLALFGIACALVVVPMMLIAGEQLANARFAAAERDKVQNIVNGATGVAIIGTDEAGRITLFNPGAQRLLGYAPEEVMGETTRLFHTDQAVKEKAHELGVGDDFTEVARALAAPRHAGTDMRFVRKDGVERNHSMTLSQLVDDRGRVTGYVSTSEDVTERVRAQEVLVEALEAERTAAERLREIDRVKESFVSSVSHELRTPITSIVGYLEMLEEGEFGAVSPAQADALRRVSANSSRLLLLIDDLLTLSRVEDDGLVLASRALDLRLLVQEGYDVVSPAWDGRRLDVRLELPDEPVPFLGDRDMIERVVVNLVSNAVKFTPDGGRVALCLSTSDDGATIEVSDTGIGIPPEERGRIFSRFFRSTTAQKQAIPGSGLGLSIARAVVEKHGGRIELESHPGEGTTFRVWLPIVT
ncbi:ATP-binding protein [Nocardioides ungokensis]|uniref:ATP-binding protein n=1 Tax=Nocardioides ungokensis TaxID=1643322 RepID=UPI0015DFE952|nr:ATP-binding protein [Nocardioides ungokensis]